METFWDSPATSTAACKRTWNYHHFPNALHTHCLQPCDIAVMRPFQDNHTAAQNDWKVDNPTKTNGIHDLTSINTFQYHI